MVPVLTLFVLMPASTVHACACCPDDGQRYEAINKIGEFEEEVLQAIKFGSQAQLVSREFDVRGLAAPSEDQSFYGYQLVGTIAPGLWTFQLTERGAVRGTISFPVPKLLERFEIDLRDGAVFAGAGGPLLYKEWRLAGMATLSGLTIKGTHKANARLILQGRGSSCPDVEDFTHWSLAIDGKNVQFTLIGEMAE